MSKSLEYIALTEKQVDSLIKKLQDVIDNPRDDTLYQNYMSYRNGLVLARGNIHDIRLYDELVKEARR